MGRLFQKYGNLLTAASWVDLTPVPQHDWERSTESRGYKMREAVSFTIARSSESLRGSD